MGGSSNIAVDITTRDVDKNEAHQLAILAADEGRTHLVSDFCNQRDRNMRHETQRRICSAGDFRRRARSLCEGWHRYEYSFQGIQIITKIASVTRSVFVMLAAFNSCSDRLSTDSGLDHIIDIGGQ